MRVLLIVDCYLPSHKSSAKQMHDLGIEFLRQGHEVTVLTTTHEIAPSFEASIEDGLVVGRVRTRQIKGAAKPFRAFNEIRLSAVVWRRARQFLLENPADLIVFYSPTIFWGSLVRHLKSIWHCPTYLILRDIFPKWAMDAGILQPGLIYRYLHWKEAQQYSNADVIAVQSQGDLEYFARNFAQRPYRLEVLYNWTTLNEPNLPRTQYRARLGLENKVVFFYGGNLGVAQDMDNVVRLASGLTAHPDIHFLLVGEGSETSRLRRDISKRGLANIQILPPTDQGEYLSMTSEFDIGLVTLDRRLTTHNIPGKVLGYLYWGLPILASLNPGNDLFNLLGKSRAGFCLLNGEDEKLKVAALQLATDARLRSQMGRKGRVLLTETFSVEAAVQKLLRHFRRASMPERQTEVSVAH